MANVGTRRGVIVKPGTHSARRAGISALLLSLVLPLAVVDRAAWADPGGDPCAPGFASTDGLEPCEPCDAGTFAADPGAKSCSPCPPGTAQSLTAADHCDACTPGHYAADFGQQFCSPCIYGEAQPDSGETSCDQCPPGSYADQLEATSCKLCDKGSAQPASGQPFCLPCEAGAYAAETGRASCDACEIGSAQPATGQLACLPCAPGSYADETGLAECSPCPAGSAQPLEGRSGCEACAAGSFAGEPGASECSICEAGTVQPLAGQQACEPCAAGHYNDGTIPADPTTCAPCLANADCATCVANADCATCTQESGCTACRDVRPLVCAPCAPGSFAALLSSETCTPCLPGTAQPLSGQTECTPCEAGTFQAGSGKQSCDACPKGSFAADGGKDGCDVCDTGTVQPLAGQLACEPCAAGTYNDGNVVADPAACAPCLANATCAACAANADCSPCTVESGCAACRDKTPVRCEHCPLGHAQPASGSAGCEECPRGTYNDGVADSAACQACGSNTDCAACALTSFVECKPCPKNTYREDTAGTSLASCAACLDNQYTVGDASIECDECPANQYRMKGATPAMGSCIDCPVFGLQCRGGSLDALTDFYVSVDGSGELPPPRAFARAASALHVADTVDGTLVADIEADTVPASSPHRIVLGIGAALLPPRAAAASIWIARDGAEIADCAGAAGEASPDPCVESRAALPEGAAEIVVLASGGGRFEVRTPARCAPHPLLVCGHGEKASTLAVKDGSDGRDKVGFTFARSAVDDAATFGDPDAGTHYALCLYDASVVPAELLLHARVPAGGLCRSKSCWKEKAAGGFVYKDGDALSDGVSRIVLGRAGDGLKLVVLAKGEEIALDSVPLALPIPVPLLAQIQSSTGDCWEAEYQEGEVKKNADTAAKAKGF